MGWLCGSGKLRISLSSVSSSIKCRQEFPLCRVVGGTELKHTKCTVRCTDLQPYDYTVFVKPRELKSYIKSCSLREYDCFPLGSRYIIPLLNQTYVHHHSLCVILYHSPRNNIPGHVGQVLRSLFHSQGN